MRLLVITVPDFFAGEDKVITALFEQGLETLHLRKPGASVSQFRELIGRIPDAYHKRIVVHDHFGLMDEFNLGGIHLNARNPEIPAGYQGQVSRSCHSLDEIIGYKPMCDYLFLSPVCNSISKSGYQAAFTPDVLQKAHVEGVVDSKVIALGGIGEGNIAEMKELGFGGVAVLGDLWGRLDVSQNDFGTLVDHFVRLKQLAQ